VGRFFSALKKGIYEIAKRSGRLRMFETPDDFASACEAYLKHCGKVGETPIFPGWAAYLNIAGRAYLNIAGRMLRYYGTRAGFSEIYGVQKTYVEAALAQKLFARGASATAILACLNAGLGWREAPPPDEPSAGHCTEKDNMAEPINKGKKGATSVMSK
jgi:hypothetical protein